MTKVDLKGIRKYTLLVYALIVLLLTVGAWERFTEISLGGLNFIFVYFGIVLIVLGLILLYFFSALKKDGR